MNYHWNWGIYWQLAPDGGENYGAFLLGGLGWTLATAIAAWVIALVLGTVVGTLRTLPQHWVNRVGGAYVEAFRNVPLLVQMFLWYFVLPELLPSAMGEAVKQMPPPWASYFPAVLCLGLYTSARVAEQVRAGIQSLSRGQTLACAALGLSVVQSYRHVILPLTARIILPPLTSEFVNIVKNSSVALAISLMELTARTRAMQEFTFLTFEAYSAATLLYLFINLASVRAMAWIERRARVAGMITGGRATHPV
ncbi:MAG: amino acid ABC transporter permease [Betaproteobacteria bacterium]|nr:amino acid ABC transporter permease [Betaproteobacteria bacterium]